MITPRHITDAWHGVSDADAKELVRKLRDAEGDPDSVDAALEDANEVLGGYGVEAVPCETCPTDSYYQDKIALYVNMGDTYSATIVYDTVEEEFFVGSWGDFYEAHEAEEHADEEEEDPEEEEEPEEEDEEEEEPALR